MTTEIDAVASEFSTLFPLKDFFAQYTTPSIEEQGGRIDVAYVGNAIFEDNVVRVRGIGSIKAQFAALLWLFKRVEVVGIEDFHLKSTEGHGDGMRLVSKNEQIYHLYDPGLIRRFLPKTIKLQVETCLFLQDGRIAKHSDHWNGVSLAWSPPALYNFVQRFNGFWLSFMLKWVCWFVGFCQKPKKS